MASQGLRLITTNVVRRKIHLWPISSQRWGGAAVALRRGPRLPRQRQPFAPRYLEFAKAAVVVKLERFPPTILQQQRHSHRLAEPAGDDGFHHWSSSRSRRRRRRSHNLVRQEPNLKCSPGKSVKATRIGAACGSCGTSLMGGRASLSLPSSSSASCPSNRSTANSRSSRSSNPVAAACRGWNRSGSVTREYASSGGPSIPHLSPRMSLPPGEGTDAALRDGRHLHRHRRLTV